VTTLIIARLDDKAVVIPALAVARSPRRTIGKIALVTGGALLATSVGVALVALGRYNDAKERCPEAAGQLVCMDPSDLRSLENAKGLGNVGTAIGVIGLVGVLAGGVLWWSSPSERSTGVTRVEVLGGQTTGLALRGRF
jgi:hypothetical protein